MTAKRLVHGKATEAPSEDIEVALLRLSIAPQDGTDADPVSSGWQIAMESTSG